MVDNDLLKRLQQNDEVALGMLMKLHYDDIYNYAISFTKDSGLVKDSIQEIFISLWQRRETAGHILSLKYYLLRAIKNKILKSLQRNKGKQEWDQVKEGYDFFHEFSVEQMIIEKQISDEKAARLRRTISLLTNRQAEIIFLKYYQHLDVSQIAGLMDISRQSVYNLLHEAILRLRSLWQAEFQTR
ncbi:MAG: RNA polymerase sigma factor [Chitinophagaceae bacterium]